MNNTAATDNATKYQQPLDLLPTHNVNPPDLPTHNTIELQPLDPEQQLRHRLRTLTHAVKHHEKVHRHLSRFILHEQEHLLEVSNRRSFLQVYCYYILGFLLLGALGQLTSFAMANEQVVVLGLTATPLLRQTMMNAVYSSWVTMTTIGYGAVAPPEEATGMMRVFASLYMVLTVAFVSKGMSATAEHIKQEHAKTIKTLRKETQKQCSGPLPIVHARLFSMVYSHVSAHASLICGLLFVTFGSSLFVTTESWQRDQAKRFAFMTMTTVGWGYTDFYNPRPPSNATLNASLTAAITRAQHLNRDPPDWSLVKGSAILFALDAPACPQHTTTGLCNYNVYEEICYCSMSREGRFFLVPFSVLGLLLMGFMTATLIDRNFWTKHVCCCCSNGAGATKCCNILQSKLQKRTWSDKAIALLNTSKNNVQPIRSGAMACCNEGGDCNNPQCSRYCQETMKWTGVMSLLIFALPLTGMVWFSQQLECVGAPENLNDLSLGYLSMMFTIVQTATTVGYGDACTMKMLDTFSFDVVVMMTLLLMSAFVLFLAFFRNGKHVLLLCGCCTQQLLTHGLWCCLWVAFLFVARCMFVKSRRMRRKIYNGCCPKVQGHCCKCSTDPSNEDGLSLQRDRSVSLHVDKQTPLPVVFVACYVGVCFCVLFLLLWPVTGGYQCFPAIATFTDCLYFMVTTVTTVGYGDIVPPPDCVWGRVMTIVLAFTGSALVLTMLAEVLAYVDQQRARVREKLTDTRHGTSGLRAIKELMKESKHRGSLRKVLQEDIGLTITSHLGSSSEEESGEGSGGGGSGREGGGEGV